MNCEDLNPSATHQNNEFHVNASDDSSSRSNGSGRSLLTKLSSVFAKLKIPIFQRQCSPVTSVSSRDLYIPVGENDGPSEETDSSEFNTGNTVSRNDGYSPPRSLKKLKTQVASWKQSLFNKNVHARRPPSEHCSDERGSNERDRHSGLGQNQYSSALAEALARYYYLRMRGLCPGNTENRDNVNDKRTLGSHVPLSEQIRPRPNMSSYCAPKSSFPGKDGVLDIRASSREASCTIGWTFTACSELSFNCVMCQRIV